MNKQFKKIREHLRKTHRLSNRILSLSKDEYGSVFIRETLIVKTEIEEGVIVESRVTFPNSVRMFKNQFEMMP